MVFEEPVKPASGANSIKGRQYLEGTDPYHFPFLFMRLSRACYSNISHQAKRNDTDFQVALSPKVFFVYCGQLIKFAHS